MNPDKNNDFDRRVAGKFENFRPEVPSDLWDKIASKLDEQEQGSMVPIKRPRQFPTWWISVAASVVVICGVVYWYNRPVAVTYLQNPAAHAEAPDTPLAEGPTPEPVPAVEPLDMDRLKQLFAKRNRKPTNENKQEPTVAETPYTDNDAAATDSRPPVAEEAVSSTPVLAKNDAPTEEPVVATVPAIQPPVAVEEEETLLAATEASRQPFGVSNILNYVVGAVDQREEKLVTFSNDSEGSLKLDFNFNLAKNKKNRTR